MNVLAEKNRCTGCTACASVCPTGAIVMRQDETGFMYPEIAADKCVDCNLCARICPIGNETAKPQLQDVYAVKHKDTTVLAESTSGGIFTAISDYVLDNNGVVYGAAFDENMVVKHIRATTVEDRNRMRGSKYVQSDLQGVLTQIKSDLKNDRLVLFTGTPCQVAGLKAYLVKDYENLICCDLICHGVPSPMIFSEHIKMLDRKLHSKVVEYKFRPKKWGWHIHRELAICENGRIYHSNPYTDLWKSIYYNRLATRPACENCLFSNLDRCGDITIGDCRGIDKVCTNFGSNGGATLAIINTQKGREIFDKIDKKVISYSVNIDDVMQPPLRAPSKANKSYQTFFESYNNVGYEKTISRFYGKLYPLKYYVKKLIGRQ